jgi:DnaK suppressor protein
MARATTKKTATKPAAKAAGSASAKKAAAPRTASKNATSSPARSASKPAPKSAAKSAAKDAPKKGPGSSSRGGSKKRAAPAAKGRTSTAAAAKKLAVKVDETPWTTEELAEVRGELEQDRERLRSELNLAEEELHDLMRDAGDGAGNDQADVGSSTFERDHEMSLANNARHMLAQTERALARIENGSYGVCESCGQPIGKMRVMAYPRATLCLPCKQREERR